MQLTQNEQMLLNEQQKAEEVCIQKYQNYAQQVKDQQLKSLFNQYAQQEQQHLNTVQQLLQGQQPNLASQSQQQNQQAQQLQPQASQAGMQNQADAMLLKDALMTEKYVSNSYDSAIFQSANPAVRQALQHIQKEEQQHGEGLYNYMIGQGVQTQP